MSLDSQSHVRGPAINAFRHLKAPATRCECAQAKGLDLQCKAEGAISDGLVASSTSKGPATNKFQRLKVPANRRESVRDFELRLASESATPSVSSISIVNPLGFAAVITVDDDEPQLPDVAPEGTPTVQLDSVYSPRSIVILKSDSCFLDISSPQRAPGETISNCRSPSSRSATIDYQSPSPRVTRSGCVVSAIGSPHGRITSPASLKSTAASSKSPGEDVELLGPVSSVPQRQFRFATRDSGKTKRTTTKSVVETGGCALVIKKTWLDLILAGQKTWEIRGSSCHKRGLIRLAQSKLGGMIVGEVTVTDCIRVTLEDLQHHVDKHCIKDLSIVEYKQIFAWVLSDARRFRRPQPYKHKAGAITWVELDAEATQHCNAASAECKGLVVDDDDVIMEPVVHDASWV